MSIKYILLLTSLLLAGSFSQHLNQDLNISLDLSNMEYMGEVDSPLDNSSSDKTKQNNGYSKYYDNTTFINDKNAFQNNNTNVNSDQNNDQNKKQNNPSISTKPNSDNKSNNSTSNPEEKPKPTDQKKDTSQINVFFNKTDNDLSKENTKSRNKTETEEKEVNNKVDNNDISNIFKEDPKSNSTLSNFQLKALYERWKSRNKKIYSSDFEETYRQAVFFQNFKKVIEHNSNPNNTYKLELNAFSDLEEEEFLYKYLNPNTYKNKVATRFQDIKDIEFENENESDYDIFVPTEIESQFDRLSNMENQHQNSIIENILWKLPKSVDWRQKGAVTPVKNQGSCGSCWAFSTTGLLEGVNYLKGNNLTSFSEQQLVDCCGKKGFNCQGCNGAWPEWAVEYTKSYGLLTQSQYPYTAIEGSCKINQPTNGFYPSAEKYVLPTTRSLKRALVKQPVSVAVDASKWQLYSQGVFNNCSSSKNDINHAVLAVGYDSKNQWILKNSWGTYWGQAGYITLSTGNTCGIQNYALIAK